MLKNLGNSSLHNISVHDFLTTHEKTLSKPTYLTTEDNSNSDIAEFSCKLFKMFQPLDPGSDHWCSVAGWDA